VGLSFFQKELGLWRWTKSLFFCTIFNNTIFTIEDRMTKRIIPMLLLIAATQSYSLMAMEAVKPKERNFEVLMGPRNLHRAVLRQDQDALRKVAQTVWIEVRNGRGWTALHTAANKGFTEITELLLELSADVNARGPNTITPLHSAASLGTAAVAKILIEYGAMVDAPTRSCETPLHTAASSNNTEVGQVLLDNNAAINARNARGLTPLHSAAYRGNLDFVHLLLSHGVDINAQDNEGWTALHSAAQRGNFEVVEVLLNAGADRYMRTTRGKTAYDVATRVCKELFLKLEYNTYGND
jgi:hypothetical protein